MLCLVFSAAVAAFAHARTLLGVRLGEANAWDFAFIVAPLTILIFLTALRYAIWGGTPVTGPLLKVGRMLRDWLPFLMFLLIYEAFQTQLLLELAGPDRDAALLRMDRALCGETPAVALQWYVRPWLTDVMAAAYFLHLVLPPVVAFVWYRREERVFRAFLLSILLSAVLGGIGYAAVPAVGPAVAYPELFSIRLEGFLHQPLTGVMDLARAPRDVFPSLHVAVSSIVLAFSVRLSRPVFRLVCVLVLLNWVSTLYLRYHYLVDVFAGWAVAVACVLGARALLGLEERLLSRRAPVSG